VINWGWGDPWLGYGCTLYEVTLPFSSLGVECRKRTKSPCTRICMQVKRKSPGGKETKTSTGKILIALAWILLRTERGCGCCWLVVYNVNQRETDACLFFTSKHRMIIHDSRGKDVFPESHLAHIGSGVIHPIVLQGKEKIVMS